MSNSVINFTGPANYTFECKIDSANFQICMSPLSLSNLNEGSHSVSIKTKSPSGAYSANSTVSFVVDTTVPNITITSQPLSSSSSTSASFVFNTTDDNSGISMVKCSLDNAAYTSCSSPTVFNSLTVSTHSFKIQAIDRAGNTTTSSLNFTVTAPVINPVTPVTISQKPATYINSTTSSIIFAGLAGQTFECKLDTANFQACTSPMSLSNLTAGAHTASIRAKDSAGNYSINADANFTVDLTSPVITLTAQPASTSTATTANFSFTATDSSSGINTIQCALDNAAYSTCTSPITLNALSVASHVYKIQATDRAGNSTISTINFSITAPIITPVTISQKPATYINTTTSSITFSGSTGQIFECKLDTANFQACTSPMSLSNLTAGAHTASIRAKDSAGNYSVNADASFTVDLTSPVITLTAQPVSTSTNTTANFSFTATDSSSGINTIQCALDNAAYSTCTSPTTLNNLSIASHTFKIQVIDRAGNSTTTAVNFTVTAPINVPVEVAIIGNDTNFTLTNYDGTVSSSASSGYLNSLGITSTSTASYQYTGIVRLNQAKSISSITTYDEIRVRIKLISNPGNLAIRFNEDYRSEFSIYFPTSTPLNSWFTYHYVIPSSMLTTLNSNISSATFIQSGAGQVVIDDLVFTQTDGGSLKPTGIPNQLAGRPQVPSNSIFRKDISALPVLTANSANWISNLGGVLHPDFGNDVVGNVLATGIPINIDNTQTAPKLSFTLYYDESDFLAAGYPYRSNYVVEYGTDKHLIVADPVNGDLFEQWLSYPNGDMPSGNGTPAFVGTSSAAAVDGTYWNLNTNACRPPNITSADAAGLPIYPLLLTYDDVATGDLQHMLRFTKGNVYGAIWPASHKTGGTNRSLDGFHSDAYSNPGMPFGTIIRLKASFDVSGFSVTNQRILRGLKKYGMILADNGGNGFISGTPDARWNNNDLDALKAIAIPNNFEVVDVSSAMSRPTSYESK